MNPEGKDHLFGKMVWGLCSHVRRDCTMSKKCKLAMSAVTSEPLPAGKKAGTPELTCSPQSAIATSL